MSVMLGLLENETLKILRRKRFTLILCILAAILGLATFGQNRQLKFRALNNPSGDWRPAVEKRVADMERQLAARRTPESFRPLIRFESGRLKYYLARGINPNEVTGPLFAFGFAGIASALLVPLLVTVFGADIVSSEFTEGTVSLLLTRPVARWKILVSKFIAMVLFCSLTAVAALVLSWAISGIAFGWQGWGAPVLSGFRLSAEGFDPSAVREVPLWQESIAAYGLTWFSAVTVGTMTLLFSVVFRSAAAAMGTMMATLIAGSILARVASDWEGAKWFFVTNLPLPSFYAGIPPPFAGMTLGFSVSVLAAWAVAATATAFFLFTRRDVS